jgi:pimeloyl-ACP methyl ester carboxylesterase
MLQRIAGMVLSNYPLPKDCPFVNQFFQLLFGNRPSSEHFEHVTNACWQTDQSVMAHRLRLLRRVNLGDISSNLRIPSIVISGSRDFVVSKDNSSQLVATLPGCNQAVIHRAGHLAPVTHAEETSRIFDSFHQTVDV